MRTVIFALVVLMAISSISQAEEYKPYCYNFECLTMDPDRGLWSEIQYPPEGQTIEGWYKGYVMGKGTSKDVDPMMMDNLRFSADPKSYQLMTQKYVKRGDVVFRCGKNHYIDSCTHCESEKAHYSFDVMGRKVIGKREVPRQQRQFNTTWSVVLHAYRGVSPLRPLVVGMDTDFYPPRVLVSNEEIDMLDGTVEKNDLLHKRHEWFSIYST